MALKTPARARNAMRDLFWPIRPDHKNRACWARQVMVPERYTFTTVTDLAGIGATHYISQSAMLEK